MTSRHVTGVDNTGCEANPTSTGTTYYGGYDVHWSSGPNIGGHVVWKSTTSGVKHATIYGYQLQWGYDGYGCG